MSDRRSPCDRARRLLDERLDRRLPRFEEDALAAPFPVPVPALPAVALPELPEPVAAILEGASGSLAPPFMFAIALAAAAGAAFVVRSIRSGAARRGP